MSEPPNTNLQVLQPSRKAPKPGDLFAMQLPDDRYLFGRVISTDAVAGPSMRNAVLVYVYRPRFDSIDPPAPDELSPGALLISPLMTNKLPWSKGYFQTVENRPLGPDDVLAQHCFLSGARHRYYDEAGNELPGPIEPVGDYGLHSFRTIDDAVSAALAFPRAT